MRLLTDKLNRMNTIFLDIEIERLEGLNKGEHKLNIRGKAKLSEFKAIKQALNIADVSQCAFLVEVEDNGNLIVFGKDHEDVANKIKKEDFTSPFKIIHAMSFIA